MSSHWNVPDDHLKVGSAVREPYKVGIGLRQDSKNVYTSEQLQKSYAYLSRQTKILHERIVALVEEEEENNINHDNI